MLSDRLRVVTFADRAKRGGVDVKNLGGHEVRGHGTGHGGLSRGGARTRAPPTSILRSQSVTRDDPRGKKGLAKSSSVPDFRAKHHSAGKRGSQFSDPGGNGRSSLGSSSRHSGSSSGTTSLAEETISEDCEKADSYQTPSRGRHSNDVMSKR